MNCPYCRGEMARGILSGDGRRGAVWRAEDTEAKQQKVVVAKWNLSSFKIESFYCDPCKKMVIDMEDRL